MFTVKLIDIVLAGHQGVEQHASCPSKSMHLQTTFQVSVFFFFFFFLN